MTREEIDEIKRHLGVVMESLETKIALVAEGIVNVDQKLDRATDELREHQHAESEETRALIRISYKELDGRLSTLEREVTDLRSRLDKVEAKVAS